MIRHASGCLSFKRSETRGTAENVLGGASAMTTMPEHRGGCSFFFSSGVRLHLGLIFREVEE